MAFLGNKVLQSQDYIFYGRSLKFVNNFENIFGPKIIGVIPWRGSPDSTTFLTLSNKATLIICGFDHNAYRHGNASFLDANIEKPYNFLKGEIHKFNKIIYIDTMNAGKLNTGSLYFYAKKELKRRLLLIRRDICIVELPMVVGRFGWPDLHATFIEKILAYVVIKIKKVEVIKSDEIAKYILENGRIATRNDYLEHNIIYKNLYRNRLIDKVIRVIHG